jgi:hypothetical protein
MLTHVTCMDVTPGSMRIHCVTSDQHGCVWWALTDSENEKQKSPFQKPWSYIPARVRPTGDDDLHDTLRFG